MKQAPPPDIPELEHGRVVGLNDPDRERILAHLRGELVPAPTDRLGNVAKPTTIDGHRFPSQKEANRYAELKAGERAGIITHLQLQVTIPLIVNGVPIFPQGYRADFVYLERQDKRDGHWRFVIEDAKGVRTDVYRVKAKLVEAIYGIRIYES